MYPRLKRIADVTLSSTAILLLLPLTLPIMLLLRLTAEGEVFYLQKRKGYKCRDFKIWKFATMLKDSPNMGTGSLTLRNDWRVTPVGRYLRITKINELPQLVNVLLGDMSIVGPRPQVERDFLAYPADIRERIYDVKPGITGIGSLVFRDEEALISSTNLDPHVYYKEYIAPYKGALELWYQQNASVSTDLLIMLCTAWQILAPQSNLVFSIFKDLPPRPTALTPEGAMRLQVSLD